MSNGIGYQPLARQSYEGPIFLDNLTDPKSVTCAPANIAGNNYNEVPLGTILSKCFDGLYRPNAYDVADGAVTAATTLVLAGSRGQGVRAFQVGDWVFYGAEDLPVLVSEIDEATKTLTLDRAITLADGGDVWVDPSRSVALAAELAVAGDTLTLATAAHAARFRVGQVLVIEGVTGARTIEAIDTGAGTITVSGADITLAANARVVGATLGKHRVSVETVYVDYGNGKKPGNVAIACRVRGEVRHRLLKGRHPDAIAALEPLITFDKRIH